MIVAGFGHFFFRNESRRAVSDAHEMRWSGIHGNHQICSCVEKKAQVQHGDDDDDDDNVDVDVSKNWHMFEYDSF